MSTVSSFDDQLSRALSQPDFFDTFYQIFLAKDPAIRESFKDTDMETQKQKLAQALPRFLQLSTEGVNPTEASQARAEHQQRHRHFSGKHYLAWMESVCETFDQHLPELSDDHHHELRQRLKKGLEIIRGGVPLAKPELQA